MFKGIGIEGGPIEAFGGWGCGRYPSRTLHLPTFSANLHPMVQHIAQSQTQRGTSCTQSASSGAARRSPTPHGLSHQHWLGCTSIRSKTCSVRCPTCSVAQLRYVTTANPRGRKPPLMEIIMDTIDIILAVVIFGLCVLWAVLEIEELR